MNRLTLHKLRLGERYLVGELKLILHFRIGPTAPEFVALFMRDRAELDKNLFYWRPLPEFRKLLPSGNDVAKVHVGFNG